MRLLAYHGVYTNEFKAVNKVAPYRFTAPEIYPFFSTNRGDQHGDGVLAGTTTT